MSELPIIADMRLVQRQSALEAWFDRPQAKNALTATMVEGLLALCAQLSFRRDIRTLVLRGAGGAFCAGGDIKEFGRLLSLPEPSPGEADPVASGNRVFGELLLALDALPQPIVCVVEGPALGGAMGLLAVADLVIATPDAQFALSETSLGLIPAQIGPFLVRKIGLYRARRLALTGARFGAKMAIAMGLVDELAPDANAALARALTDIGRCEPGANSLTKRLFNESVPRIDPALLDRAALDFARALRGGGRDGAIAFAAKQTPAWVEIYAEDAAP